MDIQKNKLANEPTKNVFKSGAIRKIGQPDVRAENNQQHTEKTKINNENKKRYYNNNRAKTEKNVENVEKNQQKNVNNVKKVTELKNNAVKNFVNTNQQVKTDSINMQKNNEGENKKIAPRTKGLKVMFLGGVGEIGKNMMALEYGNDIIIVDSGSTFPSNDDMPGIDLVVPDITYLIKNKNKIRGLVLTHGHEDHIGAIPYVLSDLDIPIYGSRITLALVENKLREFPKIKAKLVSIKARESITLGCFKVEFIKVSHSIPGSMAMAITTPVGIMVHTGDFKIDFSPIDNEVMDLARFAELGQKGVLLLTCESTNVERDGYSMSESNVGKTMDGLFKRFVDNRIIVATFASNIHRLQQLLDLAEKYGRKIAFTGRSMINVSETAYKIGELKFKRENFVDIDKIGKYQDKELLVITTGSQGEPNSALPRMSIGDFPKLKLGPNDTVIMSSSPIPGNEKSINNVLNRLYRIGCEVIYNDLEEVHASGHAFKEELKIIHALVKPKFFIPVHGEYRHFKLHKDLAVTMGMDEKNICMADIGSVIEVGKNSIKNVGTIPAGNRLVDGLGLGDTESVVLRDRKQLAEDGLAVVVIGINSINGEITSGPDIISRGLIYNSEVESIVKEAKAVVTTTVNNMNIKEMDWAILKNNVRRDLTNYFFKKTKRRPMIITIVLEN